jgi:citronellol/citronellal dehydrogenase
MNQINARGTWVSSKLALPYLKESAAKGRNPHILTLSPPLDMRQHWFEGHVAYSMAKYSMSLCTWGLAGELRDQGIGVNSLWPLTAIDTAAISNVIGMFVFSMLTIYDTKMFTDYHYDVDDNVMFKAPQVLGTTPTEDNPIIQMRTAEIMADAAYVILSQDSKQYTGNFTIDEYVLRSQGVQDFSRYKVDQRCKDEEMLPDFFVPEDPSDFEKPPKKVVVVSASKL